MDRVLKIGGWSLFVVAVMTLLIFVNAGYSNIEVSEPSIQINKPGNHNFVTEKKVVSLMSDLGYSFNGQHLGDIELERIEQELNEIPGVKNVEAYKYNNGEVSLDIEQQEPVARIILKDGKFGCYMDTEGDIIPLSKDYIAKVPVFTGNIYEPFNEIPSVSEVTETDSISRLHVIDEIYEVAMGLKESSLLKAQFVQIYVNQKNEFEMIPRVGNHRVLFGEAVDIGDKINRLEVFYTSTDFDIKELNLYDTLNLKYKDQIVCSKR